MPADCNSIDGRGRTGLSTGAAGEVPRDYASYRALLGEAVAAVLENAASPARSRSYRPLAMLSRGYDASATAALASAAGCREAITFVDSRRPDPRDDSGLANARILSLECTEHDRRRYLCGGGRSEPEFALFTLATPLSLAGVEDRLSSRILVSGHFGDT
ncbi:MAG TPA: hypothetical protein VMS76_11335, partial [Planctomycetota bacterium]|nr:hypothetical protein [Planctomycetota bacterium]